MEKCILTFVKFSENEGKIDEQDLSTIEFSRRLKELVGWKLIGTSLIKEGFETTVSREMFSRGMEEVYIYTVSTGHNGGDIFSSALIAKEVIEEVECKVSVFGERSSDTSFGSLGGYVAGLLNISFIPFVKAVEEMNESKLRARCIAEVELTVEAELPAILIPALELFPPRPVLMKEKLEARKKQAITRRFGKNVAPIMRLLRVNKPELKKRSSTEVKSLEELLRIIIKEAGEAV